MFYAKIFKVDFVMTGFFRRCSGDAPDLFGNKKS